MLTKAQAWKVRFEMLVKSLFRAGLVRPFRGSLVSALATYRHVGTYDKNHSISAKSTRLFSNASRTDGRGWNGNTQARADSDVAYEENPRTSLLMELSDRVGVLHDVLRYFWKFDVNVCRIESRPAKGKGEDKHFDFYVDFEGSPDEVHIR
jgi:hypothetical protein